MAGLISTSFIISILGKSVEKSAIMSARQKRVESGKRLGQISKQIRE